MRRTCSIEKFICGIVKLLLTVITGYLLIVSIFSTTYLSEYEQIFFVYDNAFKNIAVIIIFTALIYLFNKYFKQNITAHMPAILKAVTAFVAVMLFIIVISTQYVPVYDQNKVMQAANAMCNHDYSDFIKGGYAHRCDNQWGIILFYFGLFKLFGANNYVLIQIINVIGILAILCFVRKIASVIFGERRAGLIYIATCLFVPFWGYATFIYGNVPAYALIFGAAYLLVKGLNEAEGSLEGFEGYGKVEGSGGFQDFGGRMGCSSIISYVIVCVLCGLACALKINAIIIVIALSIVCIVCAFKNKRCYPIFIIENPKPPAVLGRTE